MIDDATSFGMKRTEAMGGLGDLGSLGCTETNNNDKDRKLRSKDVGDVLRLDMS